MRNRIGVLIGVAFLGANCSKAASLTAFAGVVAGAGSGNIAAGCTTYGPPPPVDFFGSPGFSVPIGGIAACSYAGTLLTNTGFAGPITQGNALINAPEPGGTYTGTSQASAQYGVLGASAIGTFSGSLSPTVLAEAAGAGFFDDVLTVSSPLIANLTPGFIQYRFGLSGSVSGGVPAEEMALLYVSSQGGMPALVFSAHVINNDPGTILNGPPPPGFVAGPGFVSGSADFLTLLFPMTWGQPLELEVGLLAEAFQTGSTNFLATARLDGIAVFNAQGMPVAQFSIGSQSGTLYDSSGVVTPSVPEPASVVLFGMGGIFLGVWRRLCRVRPSSMPSTHS